jgi:hypothetical protein
MSWEGKMRKVLGVTIVSISFAGILIASSISQAASGSVTGQVFNDLDVDGLLDTGEVGISSVSISAYDATGAAVGSTTSASDGTYHTLHR